jgi:hypothetical protein
MSSSKKNDGRFLRPTTLYTPPPLTHCIRVSILIHTGKGGEGEELNQREG